MLPNEELLLAIDTSTENAGIAVTVGERAVELRWTSGREQTTSVLDQIDRCLSLAGIRANDLAGIAVATGPGMFNGLRVGISLAKGFALSLGVPIVGVSTLELTARPWLDFELDVLAVVAAGRGRIVWTRFDREHGMFSEPENTTPDELIDRVRAAGGRSIVVGEFPGDRSEELRGLNAIVPNELGFGRSPIVLARMATARIAAGEASDLVTLEPVYVHGRSAVTRT
ncbi:MAG: tRNA (adenosine(37)-N6)-threonylcarbamoyltransferase complex dimerization subunit type 1 TsaB [Thermomicrobiales bacterium]